MTNFTTNQNLTFLGEDVTFIAYTGNTVKMLDGSAQREVHARYEDGSTFYVQESSLKVK